MRPRITGCREQICIDTQLPHWRPRRLTPASALGHIGGSKLPCDDSGWQRTESDRCNVFVQNVSILLNTHMDIVKKLWRMSARVRRYKVIVDQKKKKKAS